MAGGHSDRLISGGKGNGIMTDLRAISTAVLINELKKRDAIPTVCSTCGKWSTTYKHYAGRGKHWHCDGCNHWVENCTCGR